MDFNIPSEIQLSVVTPNGEVARERVTAVSVPGKGGDLGILPGHAPLLSELRPGELCYTREGHAACLAVSRGFVEVLPDRVIVLAETAERAEAIDVERARRARERAEGRLKRATDPEIDLERARAALERAVTRLQAAGRGRR